jgi:hypothetical protein
MAPNRHTHNPKPKPKVQQKVVWQRKSGPASGVRPISACPTCGATGSTIDRTAKTAYFVCPDCESTWQLDLGARSKAG